MSSAFTPWPDELAQRYRQLGVWAGKTLLEALQEAAAKDPAKLAVVDSKQRHSYGALLQRIEQLARGLSALGIAPEDAVIVQLPNCAELVELLFALFQLGARPIMALPAHRERELSHFAKQTGAVAHVVAAKHAGTDYKILSANARAQCPSLRHTIVAGDPGSDVALASLYREGQPLFARSEPSRPALFQLSGGSTNVPKLIPRTHDDYLYSITQSNAVCRIDASTVYLAALPAVHNFPLSSPGILGVLFAGGTIVMAESPAPDHTFAIIERERVTHTALVPALLSPWLSHAASAKAKLTSLRVLQVGGAKLHEALARRIEPELGCRLQQVFGMAEGLVCYTRHDDPLDHVTSCQGRPMSPHDEVRVMDDDDREVEPGAVGNLWTRGPYTIRGYFNAPEHNAKVFTADGFYCTGDRVRALPDGSLVVEGRSKEQINRGGEKIAAPEVEELLCSHPLVANAAVVAMPDPYLGERACAFVTLRAQLTVQELRAHLRKQGIAAYKIPDRFELVDALPVTAIGKVDKKTLERTAVGFAASAAKP